MQPKIFFHDSMRVYLENYLAKQTGRLIQAFVRASGQFMDLSREIPTVIRPR